MTSTPRSAAGAGSSARRPHVLLIMADQLGAQWLPCYGHPVVQAPHLDRLAAEAVVFDAASCPSPLCAPSRAAMLTGRLPSRTGAYDNGSELPAAIPTIAHHLRAAGYRTRLAGKMHFIGPDQHHGFEERLTPDIYPAGFDWSVRWYGEPTDNETTIFDYAPVRAAGVAETPTFQREYDDEVTLRAVQAIDRHARRGESAPLFLCASYTHPHDPFVTTPELWARYDGAEIDLPRVPRVARPGDDVLVDAMRALPGAGPIPDLGPDTVRTARRAYYAGVSYVDDQVGAIRTALERNRMLDDTVVVFASDHGEMLGERGLWFKSTWYEPAARVPLLVRAPGLAPGRRVQPVSLLDLLPTLAQLGACELTAEQARAFDGAPLPLRAGSEDPERVVPGEYCGEGVIAPAVTVRRGDWKWVRADGAAEALFDLASDPDELVDRSADAGAREELDGMRAAAAERWDLERLHADVVARQRDRELVQRALSAGRVRSWDHVATVAPPVPSFENPAIDEI